MKIFITGSGGFLGTHVLLQLLNEGHSVTALLRQHKHPIIEHEKLQIVTGDISKIETLPHTLEPFDAFIHIAATTDTTLRHYSDFWKINVLGTQNIFRLAQKTNAKRFIFISTANTIGYGTPENWATEGIPIQAPFTQSFYAKSKKEAEDFIKAHAEEMEWLILNPAFMLGAYDFKPTSGQLILMSYKKRIAFVPRGGKNFVYVNDVANAIVNALTTQHTNTQFFLGNRNMSFKDFYNLQAQTFGYKQTVFLLPRFLLKSIGHLGNALRFLGIRTNLSTANLAQLCIQEHYNCDKARELLGLEGTPIEEAMGSAVEWFKKDGKIKK